MIVIAKLISDCVKEIKDYDLPEEKTERQKYLKKFNKEIRSNKALKGCKEQVIELCNAFPLYPDLKL